MSSVQKAKPTTQGATTQRAKVSRNGPSVALRGIGKTSLRKLARKAGVKSINGSGEMYDLIRKDAQEFMSQILKHAIAHTEVRQRLTVSSADVLVALKALGSRVYGYGH